MKTIEQKGASIHICGMTILITFFSVTWFSVDPEAFSHLAGHLESEWMNLTNWASSGMMNPHRTQW